MSIKRAQPWGKPIVSVILVLATMLLMGCSKQKSPEMQQIAQGKSDPSEADRLKQQVSQLQSAVSEKDAELAKLHQQPTPAVMTEVVPTGTASPSQAMVQSASVGTGSAAQQTAHSVTEQEIIFQLTGCALSGSLVKCDFLITNKAGDRIVKLYRDERSRFIDDAGRDYPATYFTLGADGSAYSARTTLPGNVPIRGQVQFDSVKPGTKKIQLLEIACHISDSKESGDAVVKFSNVEL
jgi:flagellar capping protein FliD